MPPCLPQMAQGSVRNPFEMEVGAPTRATIARRAGEGRIGAVDFIATHLQDSLGVGGGVGPAQCDPNRQRRCGRWPRTGAAPSAGASSPRTDGSEAAGSSGSADPNGAFEFASITFFSSKASEGDLAQKVRTDRGLPPPSV